MTIHLNRGGQELGRFTPEEVRSGWREGKFLGTDLAWHSGMDSWRPLSEVIAEIAPETEDGSTLVPGGTAPTAGIAWERRGELGFFPALFETIRGVLLEPGKTFSAMGLTGGFGAPLFFYVLLNCIGGLVGMFYQVVSSSLQQAAGSSEQEAVMAMFTSGVVIGVVLVLMPLLLVLVAFVSAAITHLCLMILGGANRPFEATFRVVCYGAGATAVLQLLPICGGIMAAVWCIVAETIGLSRAHGIGIGRALTAVLLPMILCCLLIVGLVFAVMGAAAGGAAWLSNQ